MTGQSRLIEISALSLVAVAMGVGGYALDARTGIITDFFGQSEEKDEVPRAPLAQGDGPGGNIFHIPQGSGSEPEDGEEALPDIADLGDPADDFDAISREAALRIGFVPQGGIDESLQEEAGRLVRMDPLYAGFVTPVTLNSEEGRFRLYGVDYPKFEDVCLGEEGEEFSCYDWALEGLDILVSSSRGLRCEVLEPAATEEDFALAHCASNIGGDWVDIAHWSVENGLATAISDRFASIEAEAVAQERGLWSVTWLKDGEQADTDTLGVNSTGHPGSSEWTGNPAPRADSHLADDQHDEE